MTKADTSKRAIAFLIDFLIIATFQGTLFFFTIRVYEIGRTEESVLIIRLFTITILSSIFFFLKDIFNGASIGKRITKLAVQDHNNTGATPSFCRLILRNLSYIIWFVDLGRYFIANDKRRLGDVLAGTDVYVKPSKLQK